MQKNRMGTALTMTLFGESHGPAVGVVIDGLAPGIPIVPEEIAAEMEKRRAVDALLSTPRREPDQVEFLSGVYQGYTTGTSLCLMVQNKDARPEDYEQKANIPRPGHADYTGQVKYRGFADPRGGGHFSGRLTAPLVAAGAIFRSLLRRRGIVLGTHLAACAGVEDAPLPQDPAELARALMFLNEKAFAVLSEEAGGLMQQAIVQAGEEGDSVGGILETAVTGLPPGLGEPFFGSAESVLSSLFFSIPAVKGVEFGLGFGFAWLRGSEANDPFVLNNGLLQTATNLNGGLNGGITNGMPLVLRAVVKPTPSIAHPLPSVNLETGEAVMLSTEGRHDPCILHRARIVADAVAAFGLCDLFTQQAGVAWQTEEI